MKKKIGITLPVYINNSEHIYFTKQTIDSIQTSHDYEVVLVENFINPDFFGSYFDNLSKCKNSDGSPITVLKNNHGNNVSGGWNAGIEYFINMGIGDIIIPNNDIIFHKSCIDNLVTFSEETKDKYLLWTALTHDNLRTINSVVPGEGHDSHPGFSLFMVTKDSINKLREIESTTKEPFPGLFDIGYDGAYFEDQDMHQRILRAGWDAGKTATALYYHFGSRTIKTDDELNNKNFVQYEKNRRYFESKWGYDSHGRGFSNEERKELGFKTAFNK